MEPIAKIIKDLLAEGKSKEEISEYIKNNFSLDKVKSFIGKIGKSITDPDKKKKEDNIGSLTSVSEFSHETPAFTTKQREIYDEKEEELKDKAADAQLNIIKEVSNMPDSIGYERFKQTYFDLSNRPQTWVSQPGEAALLGSQGHYEEMPIQEFLSPEKYEQWEEFHKQNENGEINGWNITPIDGENADEIASARENSLNAAYIQATQDLTRQQPSSIQETLRKDEGKTFGEKYGKPSDTEFALNELKNVYKTSQNKLEELANEWNELEGDKLTQTLLSYQEELKALTGDDGIMDPLDAPERINKYNDLALKYNTALANYKNIGLAAISKGIVKEQQVITATLDDWKNKNKELKIMEAAQFAAGLDYSFSTRAAISLEEFFGKALVNSAMLTGQTFLGIKKLKADVAQKALSLVGLGDETHYDPTLFDDAIDYLSGVSQNYTARLAANREEKLPIALRLDDIGRGDIGYFDWAKDAFAENMGSLVTTFIPGSVMAKGASGLRAAKLAYAAKRTPQAAKLVAIKTNELRNLQAGALRTAQTVFFGAETGQFYGDIELNILNAEKTYNQVKEELKNVSPDDTETLNEYYDILKEADRIRNYTLFQKAFSSYNAGSWAIAMETIGSLKFLRGTTDIIADIGKKEYQRRMMQGGFNWGLNVTKKSLVGLGNLSVKGTTINLIEETATQWGHNLLKIGILDEDISAFEGIDKDFAANTVITATGMIAPRGAAGIMSGITSEIRTRKDIKNDNSLIKELIELTEGRKNLKGKDLKESRDKINNIIDELYLRGILNVHKLRYLSAEEIKEVGEINRRLRSLAKDGYSSLGQNKDPYSEEYKKEKEELDRQLNDLLDKRDNILNKGEKYIRNKINTLSRKEQAFNVQQHQYFGLLNFAHDLAITGLSGKGGDYIVLTNEMMKDQKKLEEVLAKYDPKTRKQIIEEFLTSYAYGKTVGDDIIIYEPTINDIIQREHADAWYAAMAPIEELFHLYNKQNNLLDKNGNLKEEGRQAIDQIISMLKSKIGDKEGYDQLIARLNSYKSLGEKGEVVTPEGKRGEAKADYDELMAQLRNAVQLGLLDSNDFSKTPGLMALINNTIKEVLGDASSVYQLKTPMDVFKYIQKFNKKLKNSEITIEGSEEDKRIDKESKVVADKIDALVGPLDPNQSRYIMSKEEWDNAGINEAYKELIIGDALEPLINKGVFGQSIQGQSREMFVQSVKDKVADELIKFNPEVNNSLSGFINSRLAFRKGDVLKEFKKDKTESLEKVEPTLTEELRDSDIVLEAPKSKIRDILKIKDDSEAYKAIKQGVRDILKGKLPAVEDKGGKKFKTEINTQARDRLFDLVEDLIAGEDQAISPDFISNQLPDIIKALPVQDLVKLERLEKDKIFAKGKKLTTVEPIDKAIAEGKLPKNTNRYSNPTLWTRLPVTEDQLKDFFTQKRKAGLVGVLAENLLKDALPETQLEPETKKQRIAAEESQGRKTKKDDIKIADAIDRPPTLKFSKVVVDDVVMHVFQKSFDISDKDFANNAKDWSEIFELAGIENYDLNTKKGKEEFLEKAKTTGLVSQLPEIFWRSFQGVSKSKIYTKDGNNYIKDKDGKLIRVKQVKIGKKLKWRLLDGGKLPKHERQRDRQVFFLNVAEADAWIKETKKTHQFAKENQMWRDLFTRSSYTKKVKGKDVVDLKEKFKDKRWLEIQRNKLKALKQIFLIFQDFMQKGKGKENAAVVGALLKSASSWQEHFMRLASPVKFYSDGILIDPITGKKLFVEEHTLPVSAVAKYLFGEALGKNINKSFKNVERNYFQGALLKTDDNKLAGTSPSGIKFNYKDKTTEGWTMDDNIWARYFNFNVANNNFGIDPNSLRTWNGKSVFEIYNVDNAGNFIDKKTNNGFKQAADANNTLLPIKVRLKKGSIFNSKVLPEMKKLDTEQLEAQRKYSKVVGLNEEFNKILENKTGIGADKVYSDVKAQVVGANKGKFNFFVPPSAEDFVGLLYKTLGKGKLGDAQMAWYKKNLLDPFARAMDNISRDRIALMNDFKALKKELKIVPKNLKKKLPGEPFTQEQAIRTYIWNKQGMTPEGISKADLKELVDFVESKPELVTFAEQLVAMQKGDKYPAPKPGWLVGNITTDLMDGINTIKRAKYLEQWQYNVDEIFSKPNLNKLEAAYGKGYRTALENILKRMRTGRNREFTSDSLTGRVTDWLTNSIGAIMFFNTRSAVLQTISAANFINFEDNNIFAAGKAFANQPQFWKDFITLFNSDFLVDRRNGLRLNVNEADIADMAKKGGVRGVISEILRLGFLPTQIADSFAIASGGSTFYRNRTKKYIKEGMSKAEAENQAFIDFREIAEESQQSSRPDRISMQQAGPLGRVILAFANTPMQYTRLIKKAASDLKNGRGNPLTNISKIFYYGFVQNLFFNAMQQALFAMGFGDGEEETEKREEKYYSIVNSMADSILRGAGVGGAIFSVLKNTAIKLHKETQKKSPKFQDVLVKEIAQLSPPISSKLSKLKAAGRAYSWNKKEMMEKGFSLDNPAYLAAGQVIAATTNVPLDRAFKKIDNIRKASSSDYEAWARIAMLAGWADWELGVKKSESNKKDKIVY